MLLPYHFRCSKNCKKKKKSIVRALAVFASRAARITSRLRVVQRKLHIPACLGEPTTSRERRGLRRTCVYFRISCIWQSSQTASPLALHAQREPRGPNRSETVSGWARCFGDRRAAILRRSSGEISAALHDHSTQKVSFAKRQSQCGPRSERWSSSTSHARSINALSLAEHENRRLNTTRADPDSVSSGHREKTTEDSSSASSHHGVVNGVSVLS